MKIQSLDKNMLSFLKNILDIDLEKDIVFIKDSNFNYVYANEIFCNLFEIEMNNILGKNDKAFIKDKIVLEKCYESDKYSYEKDFLIHEEIVFEQKYRVLKLKINLGNKKSGILCFAKLNKS